MPKIIILEIGEKDNKVATARDLIMIRDVIKKNLQDNIDKDSCLVVGWPVKVITVNYEKGDKLVVINDGTKIDIEKAI